MNGQGHIVGFLSGTAIANQNIAIGTNPINKCRIRYNDFQSAISIVIDEAYRSKIIVRANLSTLGKGAPINHNFHRPRLLMSNVYRGTVIRKRTFLDIDTAISRGVNNRVSISGSFAIRQSQVEFCNSLFFTPVHQEVPSVIGTIHKVDVPDISASFGRLTPNNQVFRIIDVNACNVLFRSLIGSNGKIITGEICSIGIDGNTP
ncbi:hypothetical protein, partial [Dysosmobacter sp.]|uniref:hypothetical protein n=1 Tax=Dysosmobacter sp. TaxID=2591382 RepID=UPI003AF15888